MKLEILNERCRGRSVGGTASIPDSEIIRKKVRQPVEEVILIVNIF